MLAAERGAAAEHAAGLPARPRGLPRLPGAPRQVARRRRAGRDRRLLARAVRGWAGAGFARAPALRDPPAVQVPGRRRGDRGGPGAGSCRTQAGPSAAQDALGRRGRPPDRDGAPAHAAHQGPRPRARAAPACADRDALRHRPARDRAGDAAALGARRRRPRADGQGQGRTRAHRPADAGGARRARPLSQRRPGEGRGRARR